MVSVTIAFMGAVIVAGLLGFISVDPRAFAEYFLYFLGVVAAIYFAYLLLLAGLSSQEKKNVFLLMILLSRQCSSGQALINLVGH